MFWIEKLNGRQVNLQILRYRRVMCYESQPTGIWQSEISKVRNGEKIFTINIKKAGDFFLTFNATISYVFLENSLSR